MQRQSPHPDSMSDRDSGFRLGIARPAQAIRAARRTVLLLCAAAFAPGADAQVLLTGTVHEFESDRAIPGAFVEVIDPRNANHRLAGGLTDEEGVFAFDLKHRPAYRIRASRLGYRPASSVVLWRDDFEVIRVDIRLDIDAVVLAPLEVVARAGARASPVLDDFRARLSQGFGNFITRDEIEARNPMLITDMLSQIPNVHLESSGRGSRRAIYIGRGTRSCLAEIFVDGLPLNRRSPMGGDPGFVLDDAVSPSEVEGIEVYAGVASIPAEFLSSRVACGVIAVWTVRGRSG